MQDTEQIVRNEADLQLIKELLLKHEFNCKNAEGAAKTAHDKAVSIALKLLVIGHDFMEEIAEMTGVSLEEVQELSKNKQHKIMFPQLCVKV